MELRTTAIGAGVAATLGVALYAAAWSADAPGRALALAFLGGAVALGGTVALLVAVGRHGRRLEELAAVAARVASGEVHLYAPVGGDGPVRRIGEGLNAVVGGIRARRLADVTDQVIDQAMVRETPTGLLVVDARGFVTRSNPALQGLVPVRGPVDGRRPIESIPVSELQEALDETARSRAPAERTAVVGARDLLIRAMPLADGVATLGLVTDITSIRAAERSRRDFVANVSHELRTPITAIVGYAEALLEEREALSPPAVSAVEAMERNARRLHLLTEDVLQLSRIEARAGALPLEEERLATLVEEVVGRLGAHADAAGVVVEVDVPPALTARVNVEAFEHALSNLVDNAVKYSHAGGRVWVRAREAGDRVAVEVVDQGSGIDPVHHPRIFERFYRGDPARSRAIPGTGLGLALVKHLCIAMGAEVGFVSAPGAGSTFTLSLPAEKPTGASGIG